MSAIPDTPEDEYHGSVVTHPPGVVADPIVIELDFIAGIGLYKLALGLDDEDSQHVASALQVQLAGIVGP